MMINIYVNTGNSAESSDYFLLYEKDSLCQVSQHVACLVPSRNSDDESNINKSVQHLG